MDSLKSVPPFIFLDLQEFKPSVEHSGLKNDVRLMVVFNIEQGPVEHRESVGTEASL